MNGILDRLFPASPMMGLLGQDQQQMALEQARQQGLLGLAAGLLQAGGPSRTRTNIGQAIGAGLMSGQQMYQQALDRQLQGQLTMEKVGEARRLREQQALARQLMPQLVQQGPATVEGMQFPVTRDDEGNLLPGYAPGAMQINQAAANALMSVLPPADFAKVMDAIKTQFELGQPKDKFEYRESGGNILQINKQTGQTTPVYSAGTTPKLSELGSLYAAVNFPGVATKDLKPDQLGQILAFQQQPSPASLTDLQIKANQLYAEYGIDLRPEVSALGGGRPQAAIPPAVQPVTQVTQAPTAQAPVEQPAVRPETQPVGQPPVEQPTEPQIIPQVRNPQVTLKTRNELVAAQPKIVSATRAVVRDMRDLRDATEQVLNHPGLRAASGFFGQPISMIAGTEARNATELLENLKNRNFVGSLAQLRAQSPTGAAIGNPTENEGRRLESLRAALSQAQTYDQLRDQLQQLIRATDESISAVYEGYQLDYGKNRTIEEDLKKSVIRRPGQQKSLDEIFKRR